MQRTHRIRLETGLHPPLRQRVVMPLLRATRIDRHDRAGDRLPEPGRRLIGRLTQHSCLDRRPRRRVKGFDGLDQDPGVPHRDRPGLQRRQRGRERVDQDPGGVQLVVHRHRRHLQRARDLLPHILLRLHRRRHPKTQRHRTGLHERRQQPLLRRVDPRPSPLHLDQRIDPPRLRQHTDVHSRQRHPRHTHRNLHARNAREEVRQKTCGTHHSRNGAMPSR